MNPAYVACAESGHAHQAAGRFVAAARAYSRALVVVDGDPGLEDRRGRVHHNLMAAYAMLNQAGTADHHFRLALRMYGEDHPAVPAVINDRAALHLMHGEPAAACALLEPVVERVLMGGREEIVARANVALALSRAGRIEGAKAHAARLRPLLDGSDGQAWAWACMARVSWAAGDAREVTRRYVRQANRAGHVQPDATAAQLLAALR